MPDYTGTTTRKGEMSTTVSISNSMVAVRNLEEKRIVRDCHTRSHQISTTRITKGRKDGYGGPADGAVLEKRIILWLEHFSVK